MNETEKIKTIEETTRELLASLNISAEVAISPVEQGFYVSLTGSDFGMLIGRHGETLLSFQHILGLIVHRRAGEWLWLTVDAGGYKKEREERLSALATRAADRVRFLQTPVTLPPMSALDRRVIHMTLSTDPSIETESTGEGRDRRVIVKPKTP